MQATPLEKLRVYLRGEYVGALTSDSGTLSFAYDGAYCEKKDAPKLSVSLPIQKETFSHHAAAPFFSGLLPDGDVRKHLAKHLKLSPENIFGLLEAVGGDCAGAVSLYKEHDLLNNATDPTYKVLSDTEAAEILSSLNHRPFLVGEEGIRMSGAGAQDKLMVSFVGKKIALPTGQTPSTHIIKPPIKGAENSVQNEFFCMRLAQKIGLPAPDTKILYVDQNPYYCVTRYDRETNETGEVARLHQEDFCQALHIPPELKYENDSGPSLEACFNLLDQRIRSGSMPGKDKLTFLYGVIFNVLIGNGDAHAKNFSILYRNGAETLAPFYDLLCTEIYNKNGKFRMAMKIDGHYMPHTMSARNWKNFAASIGIAPSLMHKALRKVIDGVSREATGLYIDLHSDTGTTSPVYEKIMGVIASNTQELELQLLTWDT